MNASQFKGSQPCCEAKALKKHLKASTTSGGKARQMNTNGKSK